MKSKYKGELRKPIKLKKSNGLGRAMMTLFPDHEKATDPTLEKNLEISLEQRIRKLNLLVEHYKINATDNEVKWLLLAMKLAIEHVPGFKTEYEESLGAPKKWDSILDLELYVSVRYICLRDDKSIAWACMSSSKKLHWKQKNITNKTLQNRYNLVKDNSGLVGLYKCTLNSFLENRPSDKPSIVEIDMIESVYKDYLRI